jgi:hypothetical protein
MTTEPTYEMTVTPRALAEVKGKLVEDVERLKGLPARPEHFRPHIGSYMRVSNEAVRRNEVQLRAGFLDYLYAPEPVKVAAKPKAGQP